MSETFYKNVLKKLQDQTKKTMLLLDTNITKYIVYVNVYQHGNMVFINIGKYLSIL